MKTIRLVFALVLLFAAAVWCGAESLQVTSTPTSAQVKRGAPVAMAVSLKNVLTPREPITITAEAEWEDEYGQRQTTSASTTIHVIQPVKINRYKVIIPALFAFVAGSAKVDGQPATPVLDSDRLTFEIGRMLLEGESVTLEYSVKAL
jgi:hypothetical protein